MVRFPKRVTSMLSSIVNVLPNLVARVVGMIYVGWDLTNAENVAHASELVYLLLEDARHPFFVDYLGCPGVLTTRTISSIRPSSFPDYQQSA